MAIYTIGDLHLSLGADKAMDIFPGWENYVARIEENW
ncbi:MAG: serine/threonine protein phosphatase, partial [Clostridiales bacterium]